MLPEPNLGCAVSKAGTGTPRSSTSWRHHAHCSDHRRRGGGRRPSGARDSAAGDETTTNRPLLGIGSQSTGAGAGKVTFNPFSIRRFFKRAQTTDLRVGSQSTGAGAGKVTFNPFSIRRKSAGNDASGVFLSAGVDDGGRQSR